MTTDDHATDPERLLAGLPPARLPAGAEARIAEAIRRASAGSPRGLRRPIPAWQALVSALVACGVGVAGARLIIAPAPPPASPETIDTGPSADPGHPQSSFIRLALATRERSSHTPDISKWTVISSTHQHKGSDQ